jgi:hypothetical protein
MVSAEYFRIEKTLLVSELAQSYETLGVCVIENNVSVFTNCSSPVKCLRSLSAREIVGCLVDYASVLDLVAAINPGFRGGRGTNSPCRI